MSLSEIFIMNINEASWLILGHWMDRSIWKSRTLLDHQRSAPQFLIGRKSGSQQRPWQVKLDGEKQKTSHQMLIWREVTMLFFIRKKIMIHWVHMFLKQAKFTAGNGWSFLDCRLNCPKVTASQNHVSNAMALHLVIQLAMTGETLTELDVAPSDSLCLGVFLDALPKLNSEVVYPWKNDG